MHEATISQNVLQEPVRFFKEKKMQREIFDKWGLIVMVATCIFSLFLFWSYSGQFIFSLMAALIAGGMVWMAYIVIRIVYFSLKK